MLPRFTNGKNKNRENIKMHHRKTFETIETWFVWLLPPDAHTHTHTQTNKQTNNEDRTTKIFTDIWNKSVEKIVELVKMFIGIHF